MGLGLIIFLSLSQQIAFNLTPQKLNSRIIINEVMANPKGTGANQPNTPEDRNEFVELYNISSEPVNVRGWRITDFDALDSIIAWTDSTLLIRYPSVRIGSTIIRPYSFALILDPEYTSTTAVGGYIQPYIFSESLLILTVGNTTIGNELQNNDSMFLYSFFGDSCSFGKNYNPSTPFPFDAGDGISWERISPDAEDIYENWIRSLDTSGSTPGRTNSVLTYYDLSISDIYNIPTVVQENGQTTISVVISNIGFQPAYYWNLTVFNDKNQNNVEDANERLFNTFGLPISVSAETTISFTWATVPSGEHIICAVVDFPNDIRLENNRLKKTIRSLSATKRFRLVKNVFSPDYDGMDDSLIIQYNFSEPKGKLTILIYNLSGQLVRKLFDQKIYSRSGIITWDGKNDNRKQLNIGIYIIHYEYKTSKSKISDKTSAVLAKKLH